MVNRGGCAMRIVEHAKAGAHLRAGHGPVSTSCCTEDDRAVEDDRTGSCGSSYSTLPRRARSPSRVDGHGNSSGAERILRLVCRDLPSRRSSRPPWTAQQQVEELLAILETSLRCASRMTRRAVAPAGANKVTSKHVRWTVGDLRSVLTCPSPRAARAPRTRPSARGGSISALVRCIGGR